MENIFLYLLPLSIKACIVIPIVCLVRLCIKSLPKIYSYVLWLVVFTGLVVSIKAEIPAVAYNPINSVNTAVNEMYAEVLDDYVGNVHIYHDNRLEYYTAIENGITPFYNKDDGSRYVVVSVEGKEPATVSNSFMPKLAFVWATGVLIGLFFIIKSYLDFRFTVKIIERNGNICYAHGVSTPFVYGIFRTIICIPYEMKDTISPSVIKHEKIHIKRGDHIIKPLCLAISVLHWFNPLVWAAFKLLCKDMEMSCDETVIRKGSNKKEYSLQLLNCATEKKNTQAMAVLFGETYAETRIKNVLSYKQPVKMISLLLVVMVAVLSTACVVEEKVEEILPSPIPKTFYEQLAELNSTEDVQYRERNLAENVRKDSFKRDGYIPPENVPEYYQQALAFNISKGYYSDEQFSFSYVDETDRKNMYICTFDGTTTQSKKISLADNETLIGYAGGYEPLNEKIAFFSYITKDTDSNVWLNIQKIDITETEWRYEITRHQMDKDNYFMIRGLRFLNENVGFMGQTDNTYHDEPQANITLNGGKTWHKLDFSQLAIPDYFSRYKSCCMTMVGRRIEIRYFVGITEKAIKDDMVGSYDEKYCIVSEDGGLTWTGYARKRSGEGGYIKLTDTVPAQILTE